MPEFSLPPEIPGDPDGMRRLAGELKQDAKRITTVAGSISSTAGSMTFDGPAGDRFRTRMTAATGDIDGYAERLGTVAGKLVDAAEKVEEAQRARLRKIEQLYRDHGMSPVGV